MTVLRSPTRRVRAAANGPAEPIQPFPCTDWPALPLGLRLKPPCRPRAASRSRTRSAA
jgi:hypothetical protein